MKSSQHDSVFSKFSNNSSHETGYKSNIYARSLSEFGTPHKLEKSGGWVLKRDILGSSYQDAMGLYPLFCCHNWNLLNDDLLQLKDDIIALSLVTDPFGTFRFDILKESFPDLCQPFKNHFAINLKKDNYPSEISSNHKRNIKKAQKNITVLRCPQPLTYLDSWIEFYENLIERHAIKGIPAFSKTAFYYQFQVPGLVAYRAEKYGESVGMVLWIKHSNGVVYYHLGAYSNEGYASRASFAIFWQAIQDFAKEGFRYICLGSGAGLDPKIDDGLTRFKRGWSTGMRMSYFCGRIFDRDRYSEFVKAQDIEVTDYFPAYRKGEFE